MSALEFKKLLDENKDPQRIIYDHVHLKIYLNAKQLDAIIKIRDDQNKRKSEE